MLHEMKRLSKLLCKQFIALMYDYHVRKILVCERKRWIYI